MARAVHHRDNGRGGPSQVTPSSWNLWLLAARPRTLPAAVAPVVTGTGVAIAEDGFWLPAALAAVLVALLLQIAANLANDVFDFRRGADTAERLGPPRVTQRGLIAPERVLRATWIVLAAALLPGLYLVIRGGWPILVLGLIAIVAALAYTGGPFPLGYHGLGEVAVFLFFGLVAVAGTAYVQTGDLTGLALAAGVPMGTIAAAILVVNNLRDLPTDRAAGKRTMAVRLGRRATIIEYCALLAVAFLVPPVLWFAGETGAWAMLPWLSLPLAYVLVRAVASESGRALNARLAGTARLQLVFGVLFAIGLAVT